MSYVFFIIYVTPWQPRAGGLLDPRCHNIDLGFYNISRKTGTFSQPFKRWNSLVLVDTKTVYNKTDMVLGLGANKEEGVLGLILLQVLGSI